MAANTGALFHGFTVTVKLPLALLPAASLAVTFTVVVPTGNNEPDAGVLFVDTAPLTRSLALVLKVTVAPVGPVASTVMLDGTVIAGAVVSMTVTVKVWFAVMPAASVAVVVTVVVPNGKTVPEAGLLLVLTAPLTRSLALVLKVTVAPAGPVASTVILDGTVTTGAVVSMTVTVKVWLAALLAASLAPVVTVVVPNGKTVPAAGLLLVLTAPLTKSVALVLKVTVAPVGPVASTVMFDGTVITGAVVSMTVTVKVWLAVLPAASLALVVTVVVPSGKTVPEAGLLLVLTAPLTKSLALVLKVTVAPLAAVASTVMFDGTAMTGAVVSRTVTVKVRLAALPAASLALVVTVVVPTGKTVPEAGLLLVLTAPLTRSLALVLKVTVAPLAAVASTVMFDGTVMTGGVVSTTVTEMTPTALPPFPSETVYWKESAPT
jgi:hypothetical protein